MRYFGIKPPPDIHGNVGPIWWIDQDEHRAWVKFFGEHPSRPPTFEAITAYERIGYRCVELDVREKNSTEAVR